MISYIVLIVITITILSLILFEFFSKKATDEIVNNTNYMLGQISYASNVLDNQVINLSAQLIMNNDVINYIYDENNGLTDKVTEFEMYLKLNDIQAIYPFISDIGIYNFSNDLYLDTSNIPIDTSVIKSNSNKVIYFFPRVALQNRKNVKLLTFTYYTYNHLETSLRYAIVISVDQKYLLNTIEEINKNSPVSSILVLNSEGTIISDNNSSLFLKNLSNEDYIKKILKESQNNGSFIGAINQKKQLISYVKSNDLDLYFISEKPYDSLISDIDELRYITILLALLLAVFGVVLSLIMTGYIHNPIKKIIDNINTSDDPAFNNLDEYKIISEFYEKSLEIKRSSESLTYRASVESKQNYLSALLKGIINLSVVSTRIFKDIDDQLIGPNFVVILFKLDNFKLIKDFIKAEDISLILYGIGNISQEIFTSLGKSDAIVTEEDEIVILLQTFNLDKGNIYTEISRIQKSVNKYLNLSVSVSIGDMVASKKDIYLSYRSSLEYIKYKLYMENMCIIDSDIVRQYTISNIKYPVEIEKKLIQSIQLCQLTEITNEIDKFIDSVSIAPYYQTIAFCNQLILTIYKQIENFNILNNEHIDAIVKINNSETLKDILKIIYDYCNKIYNKLDEKYKQFNETKHKIIIEKVQTYIKESYSDPNLSLEKLADISGLTPGYLGKLFKINTKVSAIEYLNSIRLEKSKELLSISSEPISKICEDIGIYSITYFSTLFKKHFSITPSQYREQVK
jgi:AraC-like DNA-binding protein/GGDEF domain-containing protein